MSIDSYNAFWTIFTASACSIMCGIIGIWLVLQRVSLIGDAISHSVLPGLVLVFILFGTKAPTPMLIGAIIAGIVTIALMRLLTQFCKVKEDSSLGIVFTILFALGVILITRYASKVDLDPSCVLYGLIEFVPIDTFTFLGIEIPNALRTIIPSLIVIVLFLAFFHKEVKVMAFDASLARTLGKKPNLIYFMLMAMVSIATVAAFESVGSILVIAMLIGPAAIAQQLTRRLKDIYFIVVISGVIASVLGYYLAFWWNTSVAGMISVILGLMYAATVVYHRQKIKRSVQIKY